MLAIHWLSKSKTEADARKHIEDVMLSLLRSYTGKHPVANKPQKFDGLQFKVKIIHIDPGGS